MPTVLARSNGVLLLVERLVCFRQVPMAQIWLQMNATAKQIAKRRGISWDWRFSSSKGGKNPDFYWRLFSMPGKASSPYYVTVAVYYARALVMSADGKTPRLMRVIDGFLSSSTRFQNNEYAGDRPAAAGGEPRTSQGALGGGAAPGPKPKPKPGRRKAGPPQQRAGGVPTQRSGDGRHEPRSGADAAPEDVTVAEAVDAAPRRKARPGPRPGPVTEGYSPPDELLRPGPGLGLGPGPVTEGYSPPDDGGRSPWRNQPRYAEAPTNPRGKAEAAGGPPPKRLPRGGRPKPGAAKARRLELEQQRLAEMGVAAFAGAAAPRPDAYGAPRAAAKPAAKAAAKPAAKVPAPAQPPGATKLPPWKLAKQAVAAHRFSDTEEDELEIEHAPAPAEATAGRGKPPPWKRAQLAVAAQKLTPDGSGGSPEMGSPEVGSQEMGSPEVGSPEARRPVSKAPAASRKPAAPARAAARPGAELASRPATKWERKLQEKEREAGERKRPGAKGAEAAQTVWITRQELGSSLGLLATYIAWVILAWFSFVYGAPRLPRRWPYPDPAAPWLPCTAAGGAVHSRHGTRSVGPLARPAHRQKLRLRPREHRSGGCASCRRETVAGVSSVWEAVLARGGRR